MVDWSRPGGSPRHSESSIISHKEEPTFRFIDLEQRWRVTVFCAVWSNCVTRGIRKSLNGKDLPIGHGFEIWAWDHIPSLLWQSRSCLVNVQSDKRGYLRVRPLTVADVLRPRKVWAIPEAALASPSKRLSREEAPFANLADRQVSSNKSAESPLSSLDTILER